MAEKCEEIMHLDDLEIFIYRKKTKYMRLRIGLTPPNLSPTLMANLAQNLFKQAPKPPYISLTCPKVASAEQLRAFATHNLPWIRQTHAKIMQKSQIQQEILDAHAGEILLFGEWVPAMGLRELRGILGSYLAKRVPMLAESMGLRFSKLGVRLSITRFGSCTIDRLSFSILLVFATRAEIDYVIIHELAHIAHSNHSPRFWALVESYCPGCKIVRKGLREKHQLMCLLLERARNIDAKENGI